MAQKLPNRQMSTDHKTLVAVRTTRMVADMESVYGDTKRELGGGGFTMEQRGRVLIVDDNAMNVDVLCRILRKEYALDTAASGVECLAKLSTFKPHLVLLDIMMPGMDGYETCRRIKSGPSEDVPRVILVSGRGTAADRVHGYEALADDYVVKPFDHDELLHKVRSHFRLKNLRVEAEQHQ